MLLKVAIKKFKETEEDETVRKNIQREVKMLKTLRHKNVVGLIEAFKRYDIFLKEWVIGFLRDRSYKKQKLL